MIESISDVEENTKGYMSLKLSK